MLVDSHAHLEMPQFDSDRIDVLQRAHEAGVEAILAIGSGTGPGSLDCAIQIAEHHQADRSPQIFATIGIHPHEAKLAKQEDFRQLEDLASHSAVMAWGEIGLDFYYDHSPRDVQQEVFVAQMDLAHRVKLPIVIHCRDAWDECLDLLRQHWATTGLGGIMHCFTGEWAHARAALDTGLLISFAGNITFPKAQNIRDVAAQVPLDRMLIETDSPFLAPVPHRGKRNEPAFVAEVARTVGEQRGMPADQIALMTSNNFRRLFSSKRDSS